MANCIMVLGKTGSGKSYSIRNLDPAKTVVISVLDKPMLWNKDKRYSKGNKNLFSCSDYLSVISLITNISEKAENIKNIIIDDMIYVMTKEFFKRAKETGYGKYTEFGMHFQQVIEACEKARDNMNIFFMLHAEEVFSDKIHVGYKARTIGQLVDSSYNPMEVVTILLFADKKYDENGKAQYGFYTHNFMRGSVEIPAKSGDLFEDDWIPNDLNLVVEALSK